MQVYSAKCERKKRLLLREGTGDLGDDLVRIPLTKGKVAIVDGNMEFLSQYNWFFGSGYGTRNQREKGEGDRKIVRSYIHHCVIGCPIDGREVDHINGNPLDNRRANLRIVTHRENMANTRKKRRIEAMKALSETEERK